jgi:hypothetical protein
MTVGSGVSPDLLDPSSIEGGRRSRAQIDQNPSIPPVGSFTPPRERLFRLEYETGKLQITSGITPELLKNPSSLTFRDLGNGGIGHEKTAGEPPGG